MKILFAADMSFNYFDSFISEEKAYSDMSSATEVFKKADFSMVNLENIFGDKDKYEPIVKAGPNLISDERFIEYINALNPTIVGLSNNHSKDFGDGALFNTIALLEDKGYTVIGAGTNIDEAYKSAVIEKDGTKCAIIAVCENEFGVATETEAGTSGYNLQRVTRAIYKAKENGELPIIYFHGGNEKNPFPSPGKTELYRHFIDIGARAVIAMHTHCPQGNEVYNGCPIIYSMGNFFFPKKPGQTIPSWNVGYMTLIDIDNNRCSFEVIPYKFNMEDGLTVLQGDEKDELIRYIDYISADIKDKDKIQEYFDSWSMLAGLWYAGTLSFEKSRVEDYTPEEIVGMVNRFSCEAHNELVGNVIRIVFEGRTKSARKHIEKIEELQNLKIQ